jgi:hypothetical protein
MKSFERMLKKDIYLRGGTLSTFLFVKLRLDIDSSPCENIACNIIQSSFQSGEDAFITKTPLHPFAATK